jgi:hypothetical protein|nr:MAG TPA: GLUTAREDOXIN MUTANT WITH VAL 15 TRANSPORT [Caudoviricetes sp.]
MTPKILLTSPAIYVLVEGCPRCNPETMKYLNECMTRARQANRKLHIVPSGSLVATMMRTIAKNQGQPIKYPMILMDGTIQYTQQAITTTERTTE